MSRVGVRLRWAHGEVLLERARVHELRVRVPRRLARRDHRRLVERRPAVVGGGGVGAGGDQEPDADSGGALSSGADRGEVERGAGVAIARRQGCATHPTGGLRLGRGLRREGEAVWLPAGRSPAFWRSAMPATRSAARPSAAAACSGYFAATSFPKLLS